MSYSGLFLGASCGILFSYWVFADDPSWLISGLIMLFTFVVFLLILTLEADSFSVADGTPYGDATRITNPQFYRAGTTSNGETKWITMDPKYHPEVNGKFATVIPDRIGSIA